MEKYIIIGLIIVLLLALSGCFGGRAVIGEHKTYEITSDIHSLDIQVNAADFVIEHGDKISVESNLKYLTVTDDNGVLKIVESKKYAVNYGNATLKLCIPDNIVFDNVDINTGAGQLKSAAISAETMKLKTGAGTVQFSRLDVNSSISIKGGAGEIRVNDGTLNNLSVDLGVGELDMTAKLLGESNLKFGVGESNLTLIGSKEDYSFDVKNGIGPVAINDNNVSGFVSGTNGQNLVKIKGGVGEINILFSE